MEIFEGLNSQQKEAVMTTEGPVLILAGAGSGKTRALTHRIAYLIYEKAIRLDNILAVTFTNKAANVMRERISRLLITNFKLKTSNFKQISNKSQIEKDNFKIRLPWLGTFHGICVKILRREADKIGLNRQFTIYDADDSKRAVKRAMRDMEISEKKYNPGAVAAYISQAKGELIEAKAYQSYAYDHFQQIVAKIFLRYEKILFEAEALDFDDLLLKTVRLFENYPEILLKYQQRFKYILIDEYQDTNHAQYVLVKLLAQAHRNIFAIGDDWQSIYSFRGAKFKNILDFNKDYPEVKVIFLEENYRSTAPILEAAQGVIKRNELRSKKHLFTKKSGGAPVVVVGAGSKPEEIEFILDEIFSLQAGEGRRLRDFVILYRTNAQSRLFEEFLIKRELPYRIIGGVRFYERKEIKDLLSYLTLLQNPQDTIALSRVINSPARGIGAKTLERILKLKDKAREEIPKYKEFCLIMDELKKDATRLPLERLIDKIMLKTGYQQFLSDGTLESEGRLENIEELKNATASYENLADFLESVALIADIDEYAEQEDALTLMTVHSAKGLEFPVVFISGLEEGLFPHANSLDDQFELEEERRLCYVGMTRAMERLYMSWARCRFTYGLLQPSLPSRFLSELEGAQLEVIEI